MTALAGIVHLDGGESLPAEALARMTQALAHRGAGGGMYEEPGFGLAWRHPRLPALTESAAANEDDSIVAAHGGFIVNLHELRQQLAGRGHQFRSEHLFEPLTHLWEESRERLFEQLRGQFACAIWDRRSRLLTLGRDRLGMAPLHWAQRGRWLIFASEIRALLASGLVRPEVDRRGVDHVFTFLGLPAARTCFPRLCCRAIT
jgi:asparagine synthase (glutamine-hydrolysing)